MGPQVRARRAAGAIVAVYTYGAGLDSVAERSLEALERVYSAAGSEAPGYVELHIYPSLSMMNWVLSQLSASSGSSVEAVYEATYEAWSGIPRIHVPADTANSRWFEALIGHEAVHSVLHGGLEYYMVEAGPDPLGLVAAQVAATAAKDLEVHGWAVARNLKWIIDGEEGYWRPILRELTCRDAGEVMDAARAATLWLALGVQPPLTQPCRRRLGPFLYLLEEMLGEWLSGGKRPWLRVGEAGRVVEEILEAEA